MVLVLMMVHQFLTIYSQGNLILTKYDNTPSIVYHVVVVVVVVVLVVYVSMYVCRVKVKLQNHFTAMCVPTSFKCFIVNNSQIVSTK